MEKAPNAWHRRRGTQKPLHHCAMLPYTSTSTVHIYHRCGSSWLVHCCFCSCVCHVCVVLALCVTQRTMQCWNCAMPHCWHSVHTYRQGLSGLVSVIYEVVVLLPSLCSTVPGFGRSHGLPALASLCQTGPVRQLESSKQNATSSTKQPLDPDVEYRLSTG